MSAIGDTAQHERWCSGQHPSSLKCDNILEPLGPDRFGGQDAPHASAVERHDAETPSAPCPWGCGHVLPDLEDWGWKGTPAETILLMCRLCARAIDLRLEREIGAAPTFAATRGGQPRATLEEALASRREGGDAGHLSGCRREHSLDTACVVDAHEAGLARVVAAQDWLVACLREGYALSEEQAATVLRVVDALASGVSLEARETLGGESATWEAIGARLFAIGRASVAPPDADLARVIAAWPALTPAGRASVIAACEHSARRYWRDVAERELSPDGCADLDRMRVTLHWSTEPGVRVVGAEVWTAVEPVAPTVEQWTRLRAAGVPVADGVGV